MAALLTRDGMHFLFRTEEGIIDRKTWWLGTILLASILIILTLVWVVLRPWAGRGLDERALIDARTIVAYVFLAFYVFALFIIAASYVNLSAKRFRAKGSQGIWPLALAGAPLILLLPFGAIVWLHARVAGVVPDYLVPATGLLCLSAFLLQVFELGLRAGNAKK